MSKKSLPRVLIVDDDDNLRLWLTTLLSTLDCEVVGEASNGQDGIEKFKELRPDLLLLDINMPGLKGDQALDYILLDDPDAYVILLTSVNKMQFITEQMVKGAQLYIRKDTPQDKIKAVLSEHLEKLKS